MYSTLARQADIQKGSGTATRKQYSLCLRVTSQADASEDFCRRSQNASFFLLGLRGAENFPKHIPLWDRLKE